MKRVVLLLLAIAMTVTAGLAQPWTDSVRVAFVNCYSGSIVYELEGHTAIRLTDNRLPASNPMHDVAVNFGLFEFMRPGFVFHFVKGETDYHVGMQSWDTFADYYLSQGRRVVEHELDLDSLQKVTLLNLLSEQLLPQNSTYRYNYVKDNCATRPLRLVELAVGDTLMMGRPDYPAEVVATYRSVMRYFHRNYPWYQFGIDLALGSGIDYPITWREATFAPTVLDTQLDSTTVGPGGRLLVRSTNVVLDSAPDIAMEAPTPWYLTPMAVACLVLLLSIWCTVRDMLRRRTSRWFDATLFGIYGVAGLVIAFLVFVSVHEASSPNWLLLWLNPFCLIPTLLLWWRSTRPAVYVYQLANLVAIIALACIWPFTGQSGNPAFMPLILADVLRAASYLIINRKNLRK